MLSTKDQRLRGTLTRMIAELGHAPAPSELARRQGGTIAEVEAARPR